MRYFNDLYAIFRRQSSAVSETLLKFEKSIGVKYENSLRILTVVNYWVDQPSMDI